MATRAPRPESVFVGHVCYSIEWLPNDEWERSGENPNWAGVSKHMEMRIIIRLVVGAQEVHFQETLLHEILHAVWATTGLNHAHESFPDEEREEALVSMQSPGLVFVLKHNPQVLKYIISDGSHVR